MKAPIREGDLYKVVQVAGRAFEIRYGYTCDAERQLWEPTPIYPDFRAAPVYTARGQPLATAYQDVCRYYMPKANASGERWCGDCLFFQKEERYIGICTQSQRRKNDPNSNTGGKDL